MIDIQHRGGEATDESYRGIPIDAAGGVHQAVVKALGARLRPGARVADLGAGRGGLSLRLLDAGFVPEAFDVDPSDWQADDVPVTTCDLDAGLTPVAACGPFDAYCAIEVVEHLENPRGFLRDLLALAEPAGAVVILSVPNPLDTFSVLTFFRRGTFNWFSPSHYAGGGHISILPYWLVDAHLEHLGVRVERRSWTFLAPWRHPRAAMRAVYRGIVVARRAVTHGEARYLEGQTALVVIDPAATAAR